MAKEEMTFYKPGVNEPVPMLPDARHGKVIQIETHKYNNQFVIFALKEDGSIWLCLTEDGKWGKWSRFTGP